MRATKLGTSSPLLVGSIRWLGSAGVLAVAAVACSNPNPVAAAGRGCKADLEVLSHRTFLFGHQSVGENILAGVEELARQEGVVLRISLRSDVGSPDASTFSHVLIAENGRPSLKIRSFRSAIDAEPTPVQFAFMKFCYVDFHRGTDTRALFDEYQSTMRDLQRSHPQTTFVHLTAPLTAAEGFLKGLAKRLMSRDSSESLNAHREEFNALLRQAYQGREPIFDLARFESTDPRGSHVTATFEGRKVPVLASDYTDDGGHLNRVGQLHVARALVTFLAALADSGSTERKPEID